MHAYRCHCNDPRLGAIDGDKQVIRCANCDGALEKLEHVMAHPQTVPVSYVKSEEHLRVVRISLGLLTEENL